MSNQEHHEKKDQYVKSRAPRKKGSICQIKCAPTIAHMRHCQPHDCNVRSNKSIRKKGSICQFKSTTKKRINISNQEHHGRKDQYVSSRAPRKKGQYCQIKSITKKKDQYVKSRASRKKGSICQFKSTMKERINMSNQMCPNHRTYASLPTTLIATSEGNKSTMKIRSEEHEAI